MYCKIFKVNSNRLKQDTSLINNRHLVAFYIENRVTKHIPTVRSIFPIYTSMYLHVHAV